MQRLSVNRGLLCVRFTAERLAGPFQQLHFPLSALVWVNIELLRELRQRLLSLNRCQRHFRFERR